MAIHAGVNAAFAPAALALVQRAAGLLSGEEDAYRRPLRVQPRGRLPG